MTDQQLYSAIGVPLIAMLASIPLYVHLSSVIGSRFDSMERRLEMIQASTHDMDFPAGQSGAKLTVVQHTA